MPDDCGPGSTLHIRIPISTEVVLGGGADIEAEAAHGDDGSLQGILDEIGGAAELAMPTIGEETGSPTSGSPPASRSSKEADAQARAGDAGRAARAPSPGDAADEEEATSGDAVASPRRRSLFRRLSGSRKAKH